MAKKKKEEKEKEEKKKIPGIGRYPMGPTKKGGRDLILDDDKGPKGALEVTAKVDIKCNIRMLSLNGKRYIRLRACLWAFFVVH